MIVIPLAKKGAKQTLQWMNKITRKTFFCVKYASQTALPCGHLMSCANCIASIENCAICREEIKSNVRILWQARRAL